MPVTIPDALFKIVAKESTEEGVVDVLAFVYPQVAAGYGKGPYEHDRYLTTVDEVERLTGLDLLTLLDDAVEDDVEKVSVGVLWEVGAEDFVRECR